jgi:hypothetical protein
LRRAAALLLALGLAQPALARKKHHARRPLQPLPARPEDDRRLKGDARAFAKAQIALQRRRISRSSSPTRRCASSFD